MAIPVVNGAFAAQRVTGQQRYATEIASVLESRFGVRRVSITHSDSAWRAWCESQTMTRGLAADELLLTLTSRGPVRSRRQVVVVHDVFVLEHPEWFSRRYVLTHAPVLRQQIRSAAGLVAVSEATAEAVARHVPDGHSIVVASNAPAGVFLNPAPEDVRVRVLDKNRLESGRFFLCVGSLDPRKNLRSLVTAHLALPEAMRDEYPLVIVGAAGAAFANAELPVDDEIRLLGYVSDEELSALYSEASAVLFASLDEGFGLPLVEALAAGARLLVSDIEVFRWVAETQAEFVAPLDVPGWTAAMRRAAESGAIAPEDRETRRRSVESRFSWARSAQAIRDLVSTL